MPEVATAHPRAPGRIGLAAPGPAPGQQPYGDGRTTDRRRVEAQGSQRTLSSKARSLSNQRSVMACRGKGSSADVSHLSTRTEGGSGGANTLPRPRGGSRSGSVSIPTMRDYLRGGNGCRPKLTKHSPFSGVLGRVLNPRFGDVYRSGRFGNVDQSRFWRIKRAALLTRSGNGLLTLDFDHTAPIFRVARAIRSARHRHPVRSSLCA
jgi:hypothetical protein